MTDANGNAVNKCAEAMTTNEIQVSGVAMIDVRGEEATLRLIRGEGPCVRRDF